MNDTLSPKVFLLGGYDLEMLTIKQLLEDKGDCVIIDKLLNWDNAFLSAYSKELSQYVSQTIYGIELVADIPIPENCHIIDHHNQKEDSPCALEQVAALLGITLNRYQLLVAFNDKGYIPAMQAMSATPEEIELVRRNDRRAQGISNRDESLAEQSIANHLTKHGKLIVVYSLTPRFSCICDRLFPYHCLLIYDDDVWAFYGEGKTKLVNQLKDDILKRNIYYGGGENGFVGSVNGAFTQEEIFHFVEQQINKYEYI